MATPRSDELRALAQRVADALPLTAAADVVLVGSVARGVADDGSDVELLLLRDELPALDDARAWAAGTAVEPTLTWASPEVTYVSGVRGGTAVELLWLPVFEALQHGVALRGGGLPAWQARLASYPDALRAALIRNAVENWGGYPVLMYSRQTWRDDPYALRRVSLEITDDILRLLFALNRRWEPAWKRLRTLLEPLPLKPERAAERLEASLSADGRTALRALFEVARDAVSLVDEVDVDRARRWLDEALAAL